jgi:alpha-tubulin suppressor-like RCC1 family protein
MTENNRRLSNKLIEYFGQNIKLTFIYESVFERKVLIVTKEDKVYKFDTHMSALLALGNDNSIIETAIVEELCHKDIVDFAIGWSHVIARTNKGQIYYWFDGCSQIGVGKRNQNNTKPELYKYLSAKYIIDICCGHDFSLALTKSGEVYEWTHKSLDQLSCESNNESQLRPFKVNGFGGENVVSISCGYEHWLALTESGRVFIWENFTNKIFELINKLHKSCPKLLKLGEVVIQKISCGSFHSLLLSTEGDIYAFGSNKFGQLGIPYEKEVKIPIKLNIENKFKDIASYSSCYISAALSVNDIYYVWGYCDDEVITEPKETHFTSFNDIFANFNQITQKPIEGIFNFKDNFMHNGRYETRFRNKVEIGSGTFGTVFKAHDLWKDESFAIKQIKLKNNNESEILKELEIFSIIGELNDKYVVRYYDAWIENNCSVSNGLIEQENSLSLYIEMELCFMTLKDFFNELQVLKENEILSLFAFHIACQIFIEILESLNYLHKQKPPIIHKDLKPTNIMLKKGVHNFVRITDFGLVSIHKFAQQSSHSEKNDRYIAPEVFYNKTYDTRADIYSLGVVLQEFFDIDINRYSTLPFIFI